MSYDLGLHHPITKRMLELGAPHQMKGGTYCVGGETRAKINITYNYAEHLEVLGEKGIRELYGMSEAESIPLLKKGIKALKNDIDPDYWKPTEGNTKAALLQCLALAQMRPDGVWQGN